MTAEVIKVPGVVEAVATTTFELGGEQVYLAGPDNEPVFLSGGPGGKQAVPALRPGARHGSLFPADHRFVRARPELFRPLVLALDVAD